MVTKKRIVFLILMVVAMTAFYFGMREGEGMSVEARISSVPHGELK